MILNFKVAKNDKNHKGQKFVHTNDVIDDAIRLSKQSSEISIETIVKVNLEKIIY